jgi:hypothetical protein
VKVVLRGKSLVVNSRIRKERSHITNLTLHLKELEKEQIKTKASERRKQ